MITVLIIFAIASVIYVPLVHFGLYVAFRRDPYLRSLRPPIAFYERLIHGFITLLGVHQRQEVTPQPKLLGRDEQS